MPVSRPRVVIVGGGFGGLEAAKSLRRAAVDVTLLDRQNHHLFQPLLYQVATAALSPSDIASPIRKILRKQANLEVQLAEVNGFDLAGKAVHTGDGQTVPFDYLIVATGATHAYFGHDAWSAFAPGLKSLDDAVEIRRRVLYAFEAAEREADPGARAAWLTFVIVGGGPTGMELAGALIEVARHALPRDFRRVDPRQARVILLEGSPHVLAAYPEDLSRKAQVQLERLGAEVHTDKRVTAIDAEGVNVGPERIEARTVIWAAGVAASPLGKALGGPVDHVGRVAVEPDLTVPGHPEVYVVGDLAGLQSGGKPVPGVAPAAMQEGQHAAANVLRSIAGEPRLPFHYWDKGSMATIGRAAGVAWVGKLHLSGLPAWLAWLLVHIVFLIGFRNRALVLFYWAWSYLTYERGARLITGHVATPEDRTKAAEAIAHEHEGAAAHTG